MASSRQISSARCLPVTEQVCREVTAADIFIKRHTHSGDDFICVQQTSIYHCAVYQYNEVNLQHDVK